MLYFLLICSLYFKKQAYYLLEGCWQAIKPKVEGFVERLATKKKDAPLPYQLSFQDPATPNMSGVIDLHHEIMFFLVIIVTFVL